jgi:integrase
VDPLSLDRFRAKLSKSISAKTKKPLSPTTVHHIMALLRQIVNFGVLRNLTKGFPSKVPVPPMPANMKTEDLTEAQLAALLKALDEETDQDAADIMRLALFTGARRGEILKVRWDDIDLARGVWTLRDRKDGRDTGFPLPTAARQVLSKRLAMRGDSPFVFPGTGKDGFLGNHPAAFKRIKAAAKLPKGFRVVHGLRHHYASMLVSKGVDLYVVSKLLGHSDPTLTAKRYAHLRPGVMADAAELAGRIVTAVEEKAKQQEKKGTA